MERKTTPRKLTRTLAVSALIAAVYVAVTVVVTPFMSYGAVQLRIAEILVLLCFYNKRYAPALIVGCFVANLFSPLGVVDWVIGTSATALTVLCVSKVKNIWLAAIFPVIFNGVMVGAELTLLFKELPLWFNMGYVALGEFAVVFVIGAPLFVFIIEKNKKVMELIKSI